MMFIRTFVFAAVTVGVLSVSAGSLEQPWFLGYGVLLWLSSGLIYTLASADLVAERRRPPSDRDRHTRRGVLPLMLAHLVLAGLDARFGWSAVPTVLRAVGLTAVAMGMGLTGWTLLSNPFASTAVRIQAERSHAVITTGPYALVRHPMYLGVVAFTLGSGLALGSWCSMLPLLPVLPMFVRRTLLEDRMLHDELPGYRAYAASVRWRVIPLLF
jgi:protein-S-isoprenylcysteine O-methyltransferase Ste14